MVSNSIVYTPIGHIRTSLTSKYAAPRQPGTAKQRTVGIITCDPGKNFEQALEDLDGFDYVWILFVFDRNTGWKPKVLPPSSDRRKRGVFATRSPHRPNPIGLSLCRLLEVRGRTVTVENPDLLDGTPILDIKPYLPHTEARPDARGGWIADLHELATPLYAVTISRSVRKELAVLPKEKRREMMTYLTSTLGRDPFPHAYRRIKKGTGETYIIAVGLWRFAYSITRQAVRIVHAGHQ